MTTDPQPQDVAEEMASATPPNAVLPTQPNDAQHTAAKPDETLSPVSAAAAPVVETPPAPVVETPAAPVAETPAAPVAETPAAPVAETPAAPVAETPAAAVAETPAAAVVDPAAPVAESPVTSVPEAAVPVAETPAPVESAVMAEAQAAMDAEGNAVSRIRGKMASASEGSASDAANGSEQAPKSQGHRPAAVEIPSIDELDVTLEAEISAALTSNAGAMPEAVVVEGSETYAEDKESKSVGQGSKVRGTVQAIHGGEVFLDAGLRHNVVLSLTQFPDDKHPNVGDQLDVIIDSKDADGLIKGRIPRGRHKAGGNWDSLAVGQVVDCHVTAVNKGGLQVTVSNLRGFLPASQVELGFAGNLEGYVGQKITVQVTEVNAKKRNLVVSRRALLQAERAEGEGEFWASVAVGQDYNGTVKTLKDYGAFICIGPVDGFLHIGEISWTRINHPKDVLTEGQQVDVKVLKLDPEKKRISLGMKQLAQNPWSTANERYVAERTVTGTVTRITEFGAFIELEPGLEGMVHISELAWRRVGSVGEVLKIGETHDFQVVEVDTKRKRVSLSLKALEKRPEPPQSDRSHSHHEPEAPPEPKRPRNENLRGGTGKVGGGGLFGNPSDFTG